MGLSETKVLKSPRGNHDNAQHMFSENELYVPALDSVRMIVVTALTERKLWLTPLSFIISSFP